LGREEVAKSEEERIAAMVEREGKGEGGVCESEILMGLKRKKRERQGERSTEALDLSNAALLRRLPVPPVLGYSFCSVFLILFFSFNYKIRYFVVLSRKILV